MASMAEKLNITATATSTAAVFFGNRDNNSLSASRVVSYGWTQVTKLTVIFFLVLRRQ
jgi:hypothetical protein